MSDIEVSFYCQQKGYWLKLARSFFANKKVNQMVLQKYLAHERIPQIKQDLLDEFEKLLPQIPDFGIKKRTFFSRFLFNTALSLAFFRVLKAEGFCLHSIGEIMVDVADAFYQSLNPLAKYLMRRPYFSTFLQRKFKSALERRAVSPELDPKDYHCAYVEGDGKNLLFGINYTTCAGLHFLQAQNALEIAPYLCLGDYPVYRAIKVGFNREQNLATGGQMCAFRFYKEYPTPRGWPPEQLAEYKGFKFEQNKIQEDMKLDC